MAIRPDATHYGKNEHTCVYTQGAENIINTCETPSVIKRPTQQTKSLHVLNRKELERGVLEEKVVYDVVAREVRDVPEESTRERDT